MRLTTAAEGAVLAGVAYRNSLKVFVADGDGTLQDLSGLGGGINWVKGVVIDLDVDQPVSEVTITLKRDNGSQESLSPFRSDSIYNRNAVEAYAPLINAGRLVVVKTATTAAGVLPVPSDYKEVFRGKIDRIQWHKDPLEITVRDLGAVYVKRFVETSTTYGSTEGVPLQEVIQQMITTWGDGRMLWVPVDPAFAVKAYLQDVSSISDATQRLSGLRGWDVRDKWQESSQSWRPTLFGPDRTKTVPDAVISPSRYLDVTELTLDRINVRNAVDVHYTDAATKQRGTASATDPDSIDEYERQWMDINEASDSPIDTLAEAQTMTDAIVADLKDPKADQKVDLHYYWPVELGDLLQFPANGVHYNQDQNLAVVAIRHTLTPTSCRTTIATRGKPCARYLGWIKRSKEPVSTRVPSLTVSATPGPDTWSIEYSGDTAELQIDDGPFGPAPVSPILVDLDSNYHVYKFRSTTDVKGVTDSVTIPALGVAAVFADLTATPLPATATTEPYLLTVTGAGATIEVTPYSCTAIRSDTNEVIPSRTTVTVPSGTVVTVNKPPFNSIKASIAFDGVVAGGPPEKIERTVTNQDKLKFGPNLVVSQEVTVAAGGTANSLITWSGEGVTVNLGADGAYVAPPPSPLQLFVIGTQPQPVTFKGFMDGQEISTSLLIPGRTPTNLSQIADVPGRYAAPEPNANNTESRTADDVRYGGGRTVREPGADATGNNTAGNTAYVGGYRQGEVVDAAGRAFAGLFGNGRVSGGYMLPPVGIAGRWSRLTRNVADANDISPTELLSSYDSTITVNSFALMVGGPFGDYRWIAYNGNTCSAISFGNLNYILCADQDMIGGAQTYFAENQAAYTVNYSNRLYVGAITPFAASGGGDPRSGGCVAPETMILMYKNGLVYYKPAGEVRVGERVWTMPDTSRYAQMGAFEVLQAIRHPGRVRCRVTFEDGRSIVTSANHRFRLFRSWSEAQLLKLGEIVVGNPPGTVRSVELCDVGDVIQLTVNHAHTYLSNDFLSHNIKAV